MTRKSARLSYKTRRRRRYAVAVTALCFSLAILGITVAGLFSGSATAQNVRPPEDATVDPGAPGEAVPYGPEGAAVPGNTSGIRSDADLWRFVRGQEVPNFDATVSIPNKQAAQLVQSGGEEWRLLRANEIPAYTGYAIGGMIALLVLFYVLRGRIRIDHGPAGTTIERFDALERFGHWLLAVSFIILALTGLNLLWGKDFLMPLIGKDAFATITQAGKWAHNNVAWAFMAALPLIFILWVGRNLPDRTDIAWIARGGGLFVKGVHPDSKKFNAGQKVIFWSVIILGVSVSLSGYALLFPFETAMMAKTFAILNMVGFDLPTTLTPLQEMQYQTIWHGIVAVAMMVIVVAHIYIGSLGMEGAFDAMGSGQVDLNWAKEHHNLWVAEVQEETRRSAATTPAE
ncbi:MAG: formate dehydrogenase subunit gamma [Pseudomonadota bacterium]